MIPPPEQTVQINTHLIPKPGGAVLRFHTTTGMYLGSVEFDVINQESLGALANAFQNFVAQQTGGIQIANGSLAAGLKGS